MPRTSHISLRRSPAAILLIVLCLISVNGTAGAPLRPMGKAERLGYTECDTIVTIAASVTELPAFCFAGCKGLRYVEFAEGSLCSKIGEYCFAECTDLVEIRLPERLRTLGEGCFRECRSLTGLEIPQAVTAIPKEMCHRCISLKQIGLPYGLVSIGSFALAGCEQLEELEIPGTVSKIGSNAFSRCRSITRAIVPSGVTLLESYAFSGCESLQSLILPARQDMLGELIVSDCPALTEITAPSPVPPAFDCESFLFDPDDRKAYERCTLIVHASSLPAYRKAHGWNLFDIIIGIIPQ